MLFRSHSRTDFDLKNHEEFSGKKLRFFDPETKESYIPYVVETSVGLDRLFLATLATALKTEKIEDGSERTVLNLPHALAPVKVAVLPLVNKDGLPELAQKIVDELKFDYQVQCEEKDTIGKRYRRQDAIGTPLCITIDHQAIEDGTVTIRERDSMTQERVPLNAIKKIVDERVSLSSLLKKL